jgi:hypothetical protein
MAARERRLLATRPPRPCRRGWAAAVTGVAVAGAILTDTSSRWYRRLDKPSWQPPGAVFGPVWTVVDVLIAIAATLAVRDVPGARELGRHHDGRAGVRPTSSHPLWGNSRYAARVLPC